jgi:hypothetical protein
VKKVWEAEILATLANFDTGTMNIYKYTEFQFSLIYHCFVLNPLLIIPELFSG